MCSLLFEDSLVTVASVRARTRFLRDPWCGFVRPSARLGSRFESRLRLCPRPRVKPRRDCFRLRLRLRLRLRESTQTTPSPFRQRSPRQRWLSKSVSKPRSHRLHRVLELFLAPSFQTSLPKVCPISRRICAIQSRRFAFLCLRQRFERDSFVYYKITDDRSVHAWVRRRIEVFSIKRKSKCVSLISRNDYEDRSSLICHWWLLLDKTNAKQFSPQTRSTRWSRSRERYFSVESVTRSFVGKKFYR